MCAGAKDGAALAEYRALAHALQREARATFADFESSISRDSTKHTVADGTVHPLAAYTLGYLKRMFSYDSSVPFLFGDPAEGPVNGCAACSRVPWLQSPAVSGIMVLGLGSGV